MPVSIDAEKRQAYKDKSGLGVTGQQASGKIVSDRVLTWCGEDMKINVDAIDGKSQLKSVFFNIFVQ